MVKLIVICGLPGTGKTILAKKIAAQIGGVLLRTDVIRRELRETKYSQKAKQGIYNELFLRAEKLLKSGESVILDATFYSRRWRKAIKSLAKSLKADFKIIEVVCPQEIVKKRLGQRKGDESQAKFKHHLIYKKLFEHIKEKHIIIDTSRDIEKQLPVI